jgi:TP901 family phage tail tape measure protein
MGDVSDAMRNDMADAAREVAKTTSFSASQSAEAFYFLASAGLTAQDAINALPQVAKFAQAGMFDLSTATSLLSDSQSALGLRSEDAGENLKQLTRVSDVLVEANNMANASTQEFAEALTNKAAVSMKNLGIEVEEGVAVLAIFADAGIKGSEAGTLFNATMRGLTQGVQKNAGAFKALNIEVYDQAGNLNPLADIYQDMEVALAGMSVEQQRATLSSLGLTEETLNGTLALLGNSEQLRVYEDRLNDAGGATEEVATKQLETLSAQFGLLKNQIIDVAISIGDSLEPELLTLMDDMKPVIDEIGKALIPAFKSMLPAIQAIVAVLPGLIIAFTPLIPTMTNITISFLELATNLLPLFIQVLNILLPIIEGLTAFLAANSDVVTGLVVAFTTAYVAVKAWNLAVLAGTIAQKFFNAAIVANPLGALLTAILAVIAGLVYFFTQTETGRKAWAVFTEFVTTTATAIGDWFGYVFGEWLPGLWDGFVTFLSDGWKGFKDGFFSVLRAIGTFFKSMINTYISMWEGFINFFISGINQIIRGINKVRIEIPRVGTNPGMSVGFNIPVIPNVELPRLADGGIVQAQPGGIIANIGEGRYDEAVIPLRPGMKMGSTYNITVNAGMGSNGGRIGEEIVREIKRFERLSGPVFVSA